MWCGSLGAVSSALKVAHSVRLTAQLMAFTVVHGFYWAIWKLKACGFVLCYVHSIHSLVISDVILDFLNGR